MRQTRASSDAEQFTVAAFAHDIRTSLTGILALSELLASSSIAERERRWATGIKSGAEHLAALTSLMVDAAKADTTSLSLQEDVFRPRRLLELLGESLKVRAQTKGLEAEVKIADDIPEFLSGDPVRLRAAVENLIDNAVKFTARGAVRIEARAARAGGGRIKLSVTVSDSGIGLTPAEIKRLFRPFSQANAQIARRYGGAGLGLAIVRRLAKLMGGDLSVTSAPASGSQFRFTAVLSTAPAGGARENDARQIGCAPMRRLTILCVEDNPYGRVILNTILTELGHSIDFVAAGEEAVTAVMGNYDVVLMDVTLPGIGGLEATRRIRALPGRAGTMPIIGLSGRSEAGDVEAARTAGMNFYLRKPVSPSALSEAIAVIMKG